MVTNSVKSGLRPRSGQPGLLLPGLLRSPQKFCPVSDGVNSRRRCLGREKFLTTHQQGKFFRKFRVVKDLIIDLQQGLKNLPHIFLIQFHSVERLCYFPWIAGCFGKGSMLSIFSRLLQSASTDPDGGPKPDLSIPQVFVGYAACITPARRASTVFVFVGGFGSWVRILLPGSILLL